MSESKTTDITVAEFKKAVEQTIETDPSAKGTLAFLSGVLGLASERGELDWAMETFVGVKRP